MFQLNYYKKKNTNFHQKMFKKKNIKTLKIKKDSFNKNFLKPFFLIFFTIINLFLICDFLCEGEFSEEKEIDDFNYLKIYYNEEEEYQENFSSSNNIFFWSSFILFICSICAYYFYTHGFYFGIKGNTESSLIKDLAYYRCAVLSYIPYSLIEQYKSDMYIYFLHDSKTLYEIFFHIQQFIDHPEENSGKIAIKALEKILFKLTKNKDHLNLGNTEKGLECLRAIIIELKIALIKGFKD